MFYYNMNSETALFTCSDQCTHMKISRDFSFLSPVPFVAEVWRRYRYWAYSMQSPIASTCANQRPRYRNSSGQATSITLPFLRHCLGVWNLPRRTGLILDKD